ncbi:uncharacterized protein TRUGW13939_11323 [Talaromyces rugulosus]|uniref:RCC1-like domain-containing protein n=1 Tax=Talaromyces rugulosus TaxID=121627 RepID=A0A7H8RCE8_TALRU|nr:uncharacterized protein TRUGW13939_11323 [Talaromyces rugulosus]QKX64150.1 hypothetical protein TRUGW13939_11323 [Talaromyces rugulosus]
MPLKRQNITAKPKRGAQHVHLPKPDRKTAVTAGQKRKAPLPTETAVSRKRQKESSLNSVPNQRLDVYVFGTNCYGELGLGDATKKSEIPRPVLNPKLPSETVGVVQIAVDGVHSVALTHDNQILTWGVNDESTLGRDTKENTKKTPIDATSDPGGDEDSDDDEVELNLKEATPIPVDPSHFPDGTIFTQLVATDSATFALTRDGLVYGWGTFRGNNGRIGFSPETDIQSTPMLISGVPRATKLAAGAQHVLALTLDGTVFAWGSEKQGQLGRRFHLGRRAAGPSHDLPWLIPGQCALRDIVDVGAGLYHSFAIRKNGKVYAWGSNNFGQTGISKSAGQSDATVLYPTEVPSLGKEAKITTGQCLTWGRIDNKALGLVATEIPPSEIIYDTYGKPRILKTPTPLGIQDIAFITAGTDHSFAITKDGKAYSWGFNTQHQAGHTTDDEIEEPTLLGNKHVTGKRLVSATAGGQFSIVAGLSQPQVNNN